MNIYSVYTSPTAENPIFIRQGFSFMAAIFNALWALYYRLWSLAIFVLIITFAADFFRMPNLVFLLNITILFLFGFFASEIREYYAGKSGYQLSDILLAANDEEAELRYYARTNEEAQNV